MSEKKREDKRRNRVTGIADITNALLDPVFRKRGFANRDLFARWSEIAPADFRDITRPDRLIWPRREGGADGATLVLCCAPGAALAVTHEADRIAEAVNLYFGYFLVRSIKLSAEPFVAQKKQDTTETPCPPEIQSEVDRTVAPVANDTLREALRHLGENLKSRKR